MRRFAPNSGGNTDFIRPELIAQGVFVLRRVDMKELSNTYEPKEVENRIYAMWEDKKAFAGHRDPGKKPFTIS